MKKIFSILLAAAMLFSLAMPAMAAEDTATVYFQNNWLWTDVYAYIHYTDDTENAAYPGEVMEVSSNDGTYDVYSVEFSVSNIDYIIFSGIKPDGSDSRDATPQIPASDLYRNATYSMIWDSDTGNTYSITGGEGGSLDSAGTPSTDDKTINVKGNYVAAQGAGEKISVDVVWDAMEFTYTEGAAGEWLPGEHKYADNAAGSWSTDTATITVTNHSNVAVTATLSFATDFDGVIGTFTETSGTENDNVLALATAEDTEYANAPQAAAEFGISGAAITKTEDTLGTITVAIAANGPTVVTTEQELKDAIAKGGEIMLGDSITISSRISISNNVTLNLNSKTLTSTDATAALYVGSSFGTLNVFNGTIVNNNGQAVYNGNGTVFVENCTLTGQHRAFFHDGGTSSLKDCTINGTVYTASNGSGTVKLYQTITFDRAYIPTFKGIESHGASVLCDFDPTDHIFDGHGSVTNNNDGTWTVSPKAE